MVRLLGEGQGCFRFCCARRMVVEAHEHPLGSRFRPDTRLSALSEMESRIERRSEEACSSCFF